jgi:hypothetical protein
MVSYRTGPRYQRRIQAHDPEFDATFLRNLSSPYDWDVIIDSVIAVYERARSIAQARAPDFATRPTLKCPVIVY